MLPLRYALRQLRQSPGFTVIALLILALGIGVNSAMFSLLEALLFRDAPFPAADRLTMLVSRTAAGPRFEHSATEDREIREAQPAFASLTTFAFVSYVLAEPDRPAERINAVDASPEIWSTFGMQPALGRGFTADEAERGRNQVVVLSHRFWQQRYGGDPQVLGRTLRLDGESVTIIGVMPAAFDYQKLWQRTSFWRPLAYDDEQLQWRDYRIFRLAGRLANPASPARINTTLATVATSQATAFPDLYSGLRYDTLPLNQALNSELNRRISWLLVSLAGFVLLIACANLANLQIARAATRTRELAVRSALGASRLRLIGQQLVESVIVSLGGGLLGLALAWAINRLLEARLTFGGGAGALDLQLNATVVNLTFAVALGTGILFGIVPAWWSSRVNTNAVLKTQSRGSTAGRASHQLRAALIVAEFTLALVLLGGAATMHRAFGRFLQQDAGWDVGPVITAELSVPGIRYPEYAQRLELFRTLERDLRALPGVESAALATSLPIYGYGSDRLVLLEGQEAVDASTLPRAFHVMVTHDYFRTMGIPLVAGSPFREDIKPDDPAVIIVNRSLAEKLWPDTDPIGQRLCSMDSGIPFWAEVVGVAEDVDAAAALGPPTTRHVVYKPTAQEAWGWTYLVLRSPAPATLREALRRTVLTIDPDLPPSNIATAREQIDYSQHNLRLVGHTLTAFGALGLVLAALGIYAVITQAVTQRTGEFGIRLALGAHPSDILRLVLRQGITLSLLGIAMGIGGAVLLGRFLQNTMPRLAGIDPVAILLVAAGLGLVGLLACLGPACRATRVDPLVALRDE
ncbi:ABC transporter permease [Actomonas aquatica]|uniref:ABC transporter permease n=1 Tax=Actomonas aquatica TaxID=2866162 RepID=A0ABZ1CEC9_9BACT|nr:ABC transporter permease [Opitutus sp. WL0086]WRQ90042.1 ABC transporter permease [Opitutus sp. WL0086]